MPDWILGAKDKEGGWVAENMDTKGHSANPFQLLDKNTDPRESSLVRFGWGPGISIFIMYPR